MKTLRCFELKASSVLGENLDISNKSQNLFGVWSIKGNSSVSEKNPLKLVCLNVCLRNECGDVVVTINNHSVNDVFFTQPDHGKPITSKFSGEKDKIDLHLRHIGNALNEMKHYLNTHQVEYIKPILQKIRAMTKVLDVFRLFRAGAPINGFIIANNVQIKQNKENSIAKVFLNTNKTQIFSGSLKALNNEIMIQIKVEHHISKRSLNEKHAWIGKTLRINRFSLLGQAVKNFSLQTVRNSIQRLVGKVSTEKLIVTQLQRSYRRTYHIRRSLPLLEHKKIMVRSINNINWIDFMDTVFRKGVNNAIAGLY